MISIGQMIDRAFGALWRRRSAVLGLTIIWLALDGLLLGYLKIFHPSFGLAQLQWYRSLVLEGWIGPFGAGLLVSLSPEISRDVFRAVFAAVILRTLLAPATAGQSQPTGLVGPILLIFLFEVIWTALLFPPDAALLQLVSDRSIEVEADPMLFPSIRAGLYALYALAMSRLCFVYPNAVMGMGLRPLRSWQQTRGLARRLFLLFLVMPVPFVVFSNLATVLTFSHEPTVESVRIQVLAIQVFDSAADILEGVLTLAVIAVAYVSATGYPAAAIPGTQRTPAELTRAFD